MGSEECVGKGKYVQSENKIRQAAVRQSYWMGVFIHMCVRVHIMYAYVCAAVWPIRHWQIAMRLLKPNIKI